MQSKTLQLRTAFASGQGDEHYVVRFSTRRTLVLHLLPDCALEVRAPEGTPLDLIQQFVDSKYCWIERSRARQHAQTNQLLRWQADTMVPIFGQSCRILWTRAKRSSVELSEACLTVGCADASKIETVVMTWCRTQAQQYLPQRTLFWQRKIFEQRAPQWVDCRARIQIRRMRTRWGSCSRDRSMRLNLLLMLLPGDCIDYVIVHELCHWLEFGHQPPFYRLIGSVLPDWRAREVEIRSFEYVLGGAVKRP